MACSRLPTQLVVVVESDLPEEQRASVEVDVRFMDGAPTRTRVFAREPIGSDDVAVGHPFSFGIAAPSDLSRVDVTARALDTRGSEVVVSRVRTGFLRDQRLLVTLFLSQRCVAVSCDPESTCRDGSCVDFDIEPTTLPPAVPGTELTCDLGAIYVPAATFPMGSGDGDEGPITRVTLSAYCLDTYEVTAAEYDGCVDSGACTEAGHDVDCNARVPERSTHPANCVTRDQATAFCASRGLRLPTEAEFEHESRGDALRSYPWGDEMPDITRANAAGTECPDCPFGLLYMTTSDGFPRTAPVGSFPQGASSHGALDLGGNVGEWMADGYAANYPGGATTNPIGMGTTGVARGGSFITDMDRYLGGLDRGEQVLTATSSDLGFRCAATAR